MPLKVEGEEDVLIWGGREFQSAMLLYKVISSILPFSIIISWIHVQFLLCLVIFGFIHWKGLYDKIKIARKSI